MKKPLKPTDKAAEINQLHRDCCEGMRATLQLAIQIGELLIAQKKECGHGNWLPWVEANLSFSEATARRYMRCFHNRKVLTMANRSPVTDLGLKEALQLLSTPSEDEVNETLEQRTKLDKKIAILEKEKEVVELDLVIDADEDFTNEIQHVVAENAKRTAKMDAEYEQLIKQEQDISEKDLIKETQAFWNNRFARYHKWDKKRLARLIIRFLLKTYPQLKEEGI